MRIRTGLDRRGQLGRFIVLRRDRVLVAGRRGEIQDRRNAHPVQANLRSLGFTRELQLVPTIFVGGTGSAMSVGRFKKTETLLSGFPSMVTVPLTVAKSGKSLDEVEQPATNTVNTKPMTAKQRILNMVLTHRMECVLGRRNR